VAPGAPIPAPVLATWEAYVYDGWNMVATYSLQRTGSTPGKVETRVASHVWGPDIGSKLEARSGWQAAGGVGGLLMTLYPSSASGVPNLPNYVVQGPIMDHMGNVTSVLRMDSSAGLAQLRPEFLYDYDAFGKEIRSTALIAGSNPDSYPFHFSTKYTDGETGLVYYGYRFYDPVNGRWINRDPIEEEGGINLYMIADNDPANRFDTDGRQLFMANPVTAPLSGLIRPWAGPYANSPGQGYLNPPQFTPPLTIIPDATSGSDALPNSSRADPTPRGPYQIPEKMPNNPKNLPKPKRSQKEEKEANDDHEDYKDDCDEDRQDKSQKNPENNKKLSACERARIKLKRLERCADKREAWDDKWFPGRHPQNIWESKRRYNKALEDYKKECEKPCPQRIPRSDTPA